MDAPPLVSWAALADAVSVALEVVLLAAIEDSVEEVGSTRATRNSALPVWLCPAAVASVEALLNAATVDWVLLDVEDSLAAALNAVVVAALSVALEISAVATVNVVDAVVSWVLAAVANSDVADANSTLPA